MIFLLAMRVSKRVEFADAEILKSSSSCTALVPLLKDNVLFMISLLRIPQVSQALKMSLMLSLMLPESILWTSGSHAEAEIMFSFTVLIRGYNY